MCVDEYGHGFGVYSERGYMYGEIVGRVWRGTPHTDRRTSRWQLAVTHALCPRSPGTWYGIGHASGTSPRFGPFELLLSGDNTYFTGTWGEGEDDGTAGSNLWQASRLSSARPANEACWFGAPNYGGELPRCVSCNQTLLLLPTCVSADTVAGQWTDAADTVTDVCVTANGTWLLASGNTTTPGRDTYMDAACAMNGTVCFGNVRPGRACESCSMVISPVSPYAGLLPVGACDC